MNQTFNTYLVSDFDIQQREAFFKLIDENRPRLEDYFAGLASQTKTLEDTIRFVESIEQKRLDKTYFPFAVTDIATNAIIGWVDVKNTDWRIPKAEVGYFIDQQYEGKGIISRAFSYVVEYVVAHYGFKKLLCRANGKNMGSIQVALKNGFELEGTVRRDYRTTNNELVDLNYYGKVFG